MQAWEALLVVGMEIVSQMTKAVYMGDGPMEKWTEGTRSGPLGGKGTGRKAETVCRGIQTGLVWRKAIGTGLESRTGRAGEAQ